MRTTLGTTRTAAMRNDGGAFARSKRVDAVPERLACVSAFFSFGLLSMPSRLLYMKLPAHKRHRHIPSFCFVDQRACSMIPTLCRQSAGA